jgi:carboxyl-terminal processing protease
MTSNRTITIFVLATLITMLTVVAFGAGIGTTWWFMQGRTARAAEAAEFAPFWEAWRLVEDRFFGDLPDMQRVTWGAIRGAFATLDDPYTTFLEPQPTQRRNEDLSGRFGGIGAYVSQAEDGSIILDPMPDQPADQAGVETGDILIQVDDQEITPEMTVDEVVTLVRGRVGTVVRLTLRREGLAEPVVVAVTRREIPTPSLTWRMLEEAEGVGYIQITTFSGRTDSELEKALDELAQQGMESLILDLRGNGGGLLDSAIDVSSEFLGDGVVAYQVERGGREQAFRVKGGGKYLTEPLVLLVDGGTASASEIVAGALQDRGRAVLVGEKTFGKGSVQSLHDLSDGSSVHITFAKWFTPNRRQIDGQGLEPNLNVPITETDRSEGLDPPLVRAIEVLTTG